MKQRPKRRPKTRSRKIYRETKRQSGKFLNHYDFAYAGKDTVNQAAKVAPSMIKNAGNEINNIAKQRIDQIITQGGKEEERVLPKILRRAIEDVYQTSFRMLGNFGKQQLNKLKKNFQLQYVTYLIFYTQGSNNN